MTLDPSTGVPFIELEVHKDGSKLGFSVAGGIDQDSSMNPFVKNDQGIFVSKITPGGPAAKAGLQVGDKILEVNGYDLTMATHHHAVKILTKEKYTMLKMKATRQVFRTSHPKSTLAFQRPFQGDAYEIRLKTAEKKELSRELQTLM